MIRSNSLSLSSNSSRDGKAISDSSRIGVPSCFSGGRRMVKWTRSTAGVGLEQVAPDPLARIGLARDQQHAQPVAHAVDRDERAVVAGQLARAGSRPRPRARWRRRPASVNGTGRAGGRGTSACGSCRRARRPARRRRRRRRIVDPHRQSAPRRRCRRPARSTVMRRSLSSALPVEQHMERRRGRLAGSAGASCTSPSVITIAPASRSAALSARASGRR